MHCLWFWVFELQAFLFTLDALDGPFFQGVADSAPGALRSDLSLSGKNGSGNLNPLRMKEFTATLSEAVGQERFPGPSAQVFTQVADLVFSP